MKGLFVCVVCICSSMAWAQPSKLPTNARPGYIITTDGDSQQVWLVQRGPVEAQRQVVAYDQNGGRKEYQAAQLARYYDGQHVRHALRVNKVWLLLPAKLRGAATLYNYYYADKAKVFAGYVVQKQGLETERFDFNSFTVKKQIREYFNDYPPASWAEFDRGYEITELERLVADYNQWVAAGKPKLKPQQPNPNDD